jgi:3-deoxy-7-phosphoheptulonate synthase
MNVRILEKVPTVSELELTHPLTDRMRECVVGGRKEVRAILEREDDRFLVIVGPCSAWPSPAVLEYAHRLGQLKSEVEDKIKIVMRVYTQKPRTTKGWVGPAVHPDPFGEPNTADGMRYVRSMMMNVLDLGLPIADEALFSYSTRGVMDMLSWVAIGARSAEDQERRIFASSVPIPVGMKNPTSGSIDIGINSVVAAQHNHMMVSGDMEMRTNGNRHAHLVLRGGSNGPNYTRADIERAQKLLHSSGVDNPAILVDASHDNCRVEGVKDPDHMVRVVSNVLSSRRDMVDGSVVRGVMIESFLKCGSQSIDGKGAHEIDMDGLSITDPCLGWDETAELIRYIHSNI